MSSADSAGLSASPRRVAVTGASGFVGGVLCEELEQRGFEVVRLARPELASMLAGEGADGALRGCASAIHLAGRAHVLRESERDREAVYRVANRDTTVALAEACVRTGVRRLVFVSSIHVNGPSSVRPFRPEDKPAPREPYAVSKLEAERGLWNVASRSELEVVIVRPPLVYGPYVKANFLRLLKLTALPFPLPLGGVSGQRSLIAVWNLADLLIRCLDHPSAPGHTLLVSDGEDFELPELIRVLSRGMGKEARLINVPEDMLRAGLSAMGMRQSFDKLADSLQVDASETCRLLNWRPPLAAREALERTGKWYVESRGRASAA